MILYNCRYIQLMDITLSFIRKRKPTKLLKKLKEDKFIIEEFRPGIYYVSRNDSIAIQIVVSKELDKRNHIWLNSLTDELSEEHAKKLVYMTNDLKELDDKYYADSVWEIVTTQNKQLLEEMREDEDMCKAMAELFKPEIDAAFDNGFNNGFGDGVENKGIQVFKNMIERGFSREEAQQLADISDELVERGLEK